MYIEYRSYFLFNRFLPNSCILTRVKRTVFFSQFFEGLSGGFVLESWFFVLVKLSD
mgnify:CR=1 FL=1